MPLLKDKQISCREILLSVLDEIDTTEHQVQAYVTVRDRKELISEADMIDARRLRGENVGELSGLPIALKDNICAQNLRTTCASKMLSNFVPAYSATIVERIKEADGIIIGKTNMDEFCMGSSTEKSAFKTTRNPRNLDFVPGGTSGGSAAAVAANETILAVGVDTGGSIRQPASYCGVVGMKPTYGRVSRYGIIAYGSSLDQAGPLAKDVKDSALLMHVLSGPDPRDATTFMGEVPSYLDKIEQTQRLRIGIPEEYMGPGINQEVRDSIEKAIVLLKKDGQEIIPIELPHTESAIPCYYIIACCEASSNLSRYSGALFGYRAQDYSNLDDMLTKSRTEGFGPEVKRRIMLGTFALSSGYYDAYYLKAARVRTLIRQDFDHAFQSCDLIIHPVAPTPAFRIGEKMVNDPVVMYLVDIYTVTANLAGLPAISIPCGWANNNLPIGIQITGRHFDELTVLSIAYRLEQLLNRADIFVR
jgi:aspartyl-tRNA(Asn)/glutamyl-tRNA(Gln) amidotransferase subunit A